MHSDIFNTYQHSYYLFTWMKTLFGHYVSLDIYTAQYKLYIICWDKKSFVLKFDTFLSLALFSFQLFYLPFSVFVVNQIAKWNYRIVHIAKSINGFCMIIEWTVTSFCLNSCYKNKIWFFFNTIRFYKMFLNKSTFENIKIWFAKSKTYIFLTISRFRKAAECKTYER